MSIGKTVITDEDMYTNEAIMAFLDKGTYKIDTNYLYHLCKGIDWFKGTNKAVSMGLVMTVFDFVLRLPLFVYVYTGWWGCACFCT